MAELHRLSEHCGFQDFENMLRDHLVCGMRDTRIQKKLLAETGLTFKKAFDTAQAVETAEQQAKELQVNGWGSERFTEYTARTRQSQVERIAQSSKPGATIVEEPSTIPPIVVSRKQLAGLVAKWDIY